MTKPRQRKNAAARRAEIVETAIKLSAEIGPSKVTTQHLADAVGVTQPAIFRHFNTKSEIWLAVAESIGDGFRNLHDAATEDEESNPHDLLHQVIRQHFDHVAANPALSGIIHSRELHSEIQGFREHFEELVAHGRNRLGRLFHRAQAAGIHSAHVAAEDAAYMLTALMEGVALRWSLSDRTFDLADEGSRLAANLVDSFRS